MPINAILITGSKKDSKPAKPQDLVRLYETIISNLSELPTLAGLEDDLEFKQLVEAKVTFFKAWRCCFLAQAFLYAQKWPEAMALFQRATAYGNKANQDKMLEKSLRVEVPKLLEMIESRQFMAHANSILQGESAAKVEKGDKGKAAADLAKLPLIDRLDEYYDDPDLVKGKIWFMCLV